MPKTSRSERGYATLFSETDKLVKRVRKTNLEAMENYVNGTKLREALVNLVHSWDKFTYEINEAHGVYPVRVDVSNKHKKGGGNNGS
jgi:hypothetical protein